MSYIFHIQSLQPSDLILALLWQHLPRVLFYPIYREFGIELNMDFRIGSMLVLGIGIVLRPGLKLKMGILLVFTESKLFLYVLYN